MTAKSNDADIRELQTNMQDARNDITEVKKDVKSILDKLENVYVKRSEFNSFKWTTIPITIIVSAALTFLVTFYFSHRNDQQASSPSVTTTQNNSSASEPQDTRSGSTPQTSDTAKPSETQKQPNENGGVNVTLPKIP